ncbi:tRNA-specific adenosine deaminase subunit tad3 [Neolecta irregularis DAH-3]|uniref:tRNA-specific adenosine deaminase subunit tad3 n=1 Tax=Neolecta irregularis (strain DAH-3) TaxID=1198029 RepID=A0A1U7LQB4_NEOID|nr:tRNA-specific adenosine deaminase subunit tad3 [Neolecta irregularis DAH-3]|eukprot:OLL24834.1 tRNA-specific adenosine deaminase subunit tad3 [Neolecta irregularis DAH-3]
MSPPNPFAHPVSAIPVYIATVPRLATKALLAQVTRIKISHDLSHLKRFRATATVDDELDMLLCPVDALNKHDLEQLISFPVREEFVPRDPAYVDSQYLAASLLWPLKNPPRIVEIKDIQYIKHYIQKLSVTCKTTLIVDPKSQELISSSIDSRDEHPLHHSIMNAISAVAETERIRRGGNHNQPFKPGNNYLCSGLDVFTTFEPCVMCSMALVHSRISRLFYLRSQAEGGIESAYYIHGRRELNHKFMSFRWVGGI